MKFCDKMDALHEKATPGKWRKGSPQICCKLPHFPHGQGQCEYKHHDWSDDSDIHQDRQYSGVEDVEVGLIAGMWDYESGGIKKEEDAELMAESHNALPAMLKAIRAAEEHVANCPGCGGLGESCYCSCHSSVSSRAGCVHCKPEHFKDKPDPYVHPCTCAALRSALADLNEQAEQKERM